MKAKRFTYHWAIVIACFILMASSVGITQNCFNLFSIEIMNELKFTASQVQVMNTIATLMTMVSALVVGTVFNKFSMRLAMPVYAICLTGGFFLYSTVNSLAQLYILSALVGFGRGGVAVVPCGLLMNNWFKEKRGFATGIALAGSTAGGFVFVRIANAIIASMYWRRAYMVLGVMAAVLIIPTVIFVIREKPEDKGLRPYGATDEDTASAVKAEFTGISRKKFLKTSAFWMLGITFFLISAINMGLQNNVSIYLTMQKGQTRELAADVASILLLSQVVGKILLGSIYDKKGVKFGSAYGCAVFLLSIVTIMLAGNKAFAIIFGVIVGLALSMTTCTPPLLTSLAVGRREYSSIYGLLNAFATAGVALGPVIAGFIYDHTESYDLAWIIFAVVAVVILVLTILAMNKSKGYSSMTEG
ncbi:MAG TPA: MFS transporter [Candidatus Scatomorpha merdavium]|nr:MFS transporter [Candidatus Scatomorpha merdavium]